MDSVVTVLQWVVVLTASVIVGYVAVDEWRHRRLVDNLNRAHRQRMAMIDMLEAAALDVVEFERVADAMMAVSHTKHARALQRGTPLTQVYPAELWGVAKAAEGVE